MADATDGPPPDTEPPASLPGTLGNGPTGQTLPGNPPPDSGALRTRRRLHRIPRSLEGEELRALGSCFPNFTNRTPGAQAGEARELCPPHPIEGYEIEEIVRSAAAVANAKIRFRTSGRSWTALIRLSRIDGTTPAADWEPGAWKLMGYEVVPSLTRRRTYCKAMFLRLDERRYAARPRWCHKAEGMPSGLV